VSAERILENSIPVSDIGKHRAGVAAAHGDDNVGGLHGVAVRIVGVCAEMSMPTSAIGTQ